VTRLLGFRDWQGFLPINGFVSSAIVIVCVVGCAWWFGSSSRWRRVLSSVASRVIVALFVVQGIGLYAMQLQHATGWGNINLRYFLPGLMLFGVILATGSLAWPRLRGQLAVVIMALLALGAIGDIVWFAAPMYKKISIENPIAFLPTALANNAIPFAIVPVLGVAVIAGLAVVSVALLAATRPEHLDTLQEGKAVG